MRPRRLSILLALFAATLIDPSTATAADPTDPTDLALAGGRLTPADAAALEKHLASTPADLSARAKLIGYYFTRYTEGDDKTARRRHILWLIHHHPASPLAASPFTSIDPIVDESGFADAKNAWLKQVRSHADNAEVIGNAAAFFTLHDPESAERLLEKAEMADPNNPRWPQQLAHMYHLQVIGADDGQKVVLAGKAFQKQEQALKLTPSEDQKFYLLPDLCRFALDAHDHDAAARYAAQLLAAAPGYERNWNHGNAIHHGNITLGHVALKNGDTAKAKAHLLAAGKTPGSPQLNSFGPDLALAQVLLERDERDAVLQYLQSCNTFWRSGRKQLDQWIGQIQTGQTPAMAR